MSTPSAKDFNVLIMAAGAAKRFGSCKLLATLNNKPVIAHCLDTFSTFPFNQIYVASGAYHADIIHYTEHRYTSDEQQNLTVLQINNWQKGMGHSIAEAYQSISSHKPILLTLADLPFISASDINFLLHHAILNPSKIVAAFNGQTLCPPVVFPLTYVDHLNRLSGDFGAKSLLNRYPDQLLSLTLKNAAFDIDTQQQLEQANK